MLWTPCSTGKTRSGTTFSAWASDFNLSAAVQRAVLAENEAERMNSVDEEWPPPPRDPLNEVDDQYPPEAPDPSNTVDDASPSPPLSKKRKRSPPVIFEDVVAAGKPLSGSHRRRRVKRKLEVQANGHKPLLSTTNQVVAPSLPLFAPILNAATLPTASGAYGAKNETEDEKRGGSQRRSVKDLLASGFQLIKWDGIGARPLVDSCRRIFAVLAGQPTKNGFANAVSRAYSFIKEQGAAAPFTPNMLHHRRGLFAAINVGIVLGKGQPDPTRNNNHGCVALENALLGNADIQRMAHFASSAFAMWAPRLHAHYVSNNRKLHKKLPHLQRPFPESVFSCAAFNFATASAPNVWTFKHRDVTNLPFGWCAVQALGIFDATKGGHLILWDAKLVIEFPSGALILLPSATIAHSNVPVQDGDERISFTQFTAGAIFRWVDNGGCTLAKLAKDNPARFAELTKEREKRWEMGLGLFSTVEELVLQK